MIVYEIIIFIGNFYLYSKNVLLYRPRYHYLSKLDVLHRNLSHNCLLFIHLSVIVYEIIIFIEIGIEMASSVMVDLDVVDEPSNVSGRS